VRLLLLCSLLSFPALADDYLVAAQDLPAGSKVTLELLSQKKSGAKIPGTVKPDNVKVVLNQSLMVPLRKGDLLMWFAFSTDSSANTRCNKSDAPR